MSLNAGEDCHKLFFSVLPLVQTLHPLTLSPCQEPR